jgi:hypothetical protein
MRSFRRWRFDALARRLAEMPTAAIGPQASTRLMSAATIAGGSSWRVEAELHGPGGARPEDYQEGPRGLPREAQAALPSGQSTNARKSESLTLAQLAEQV